MPKLNHRACVASASASISITASSPGWPAIPKSKTQIKEGKEKGSSTVPAVYDTNADIEEEYRLFLENVCVHKNEDFVVEYEGKVIRYGDQAVADGGGNREDPVNEKKKVMDVVGISLDNVYTKSVPEPNPLHSRASRRKVKEVVDLEMDEKNEAAPLLKGKGVEKVIEMEMEDERLVLALPKMGTTTSLTNTSDGHETEAHTTSNKDPHLPRVLVISA
uniref:Uncharacterized protein n=1 Tax=Oryza punctata TaxID=4537 RepID=A0A0E0KN82_ORYPU